MLKISRRALLAGASLVAMVKKSKAWLPHGKAVIPTPPTPGTLSTAGGDGSVPTISAVEHGTGWPYFVVAAWDTHTHAFFDPSDVATITVGASTGDTAGIASVTFYLNGNSTVVSTPQQNPVTGSYGYCITVNTTGGTDGDYTLYARVVPVNGFELLINLPITINTNGNITRPLRYVDFGLGSDSNNGLAPGAGNAWKTINHALAASSSATAGATEIICATGTYLENANITGGSINSNTRMIKVRPATGANVVISRTTRGSPTQDIKLGCNYAQLIGMTLDWAQVNVAATASATVYTQMTITDSNGVLGPLYGYSAAEVFDAFYVTALEECTVNAAIFPGQLERNNVSNVTWDAWPVNGSVFTDTTSGKTARFGVQLLQPAQFQQRVGTNQTCTVSSSTLSGGNTIVQLNAGSIASTISQGQISVVAGTFTAKTITGTADNGSGRTRVAVNSTTGLTNGDSIMIRQFVGSGDLASGGNPLNDRWDGITVIDSTHFDLPANSAGGTPGTYAANTSNPAGMARLSGGTVFWNSGFSSATGGGTQQVAINGVDLTSKIQAGDTVWLSTPAHADNDQYFTGTANAIPYYTNIYWQRVKSVGMGLQSVLCQPGSAGTATVSGGAVGDSNIITFTVAQTLGANAWIYVTSGPLSGTGYRIASAISSSTTATLANPTPSSLSSASCTLVRSVNNHAQVECFFNTYGTNSVAGQIQGGNVGWVIDGCTFIGQLYRWVTSGGNDGWGKCTEAFTIRNSIFLQVDSTGGTFPSAGYSMNNCQLLQGSAPALATNTTVTGATFNTTIGNNYGRPTSGVTKTMTPPIAFDCSGRAIAAGTNIGALAI